jgi:hypothetical protein
MGAKLNFEGIHHVKNMLHLGDAIEVPNTNVSPPLCMVKDLSHLNVVRQSLYVVL